MLPRVLRVSGWRARSAGSGAATSAAVPNVASAGANELIAAADLVDDGRVITGRTSTVGAAFTAEQPRLQALPAEAFDPAVVLSKRVDSRARVSVRQSFYSVPARLAGGGG